MRQELRDILDDMDFKLESASLQCNGLMVHTPRTEGAIRRLVELKHAIGLAEQKRTELEAYLTGEER